METEMHLEIYRKRAEIKAIIHAHPVFATSFSFSEDIKINTALTGETYAFTGVPKFAKYATMGSQELAENVSNATLKSDCIIMEHHGILTVGNSLIDAFHKMELMESSAKMTLIAKFLGTNESLSKENLLKIDKLVERI
jgi:L-fuculose-phosphate aldolase